MKGLTYDLRLTLCHCRNRWLTGRAAREAVAGGEDAVRRTFRTAPFRCPTADRGSAHRSRGRSSSLQHLVALADTNRDGLLEQQEVRNAAREVFRAADRGHDGVLDRRELGGLLSARARAEADLDRDETVDEKEYLAIVDQRFRATDTNHNRSLDLGELQTRAGTALLKLLR